MIDALAGAKLITVPGVSTRIAAQILVIMVDTPGTVINLCGRGAGVSGRRDLGRAVRGDGVRGDECS
jgi:hypothetical protein